LDNKIFYVIDARYNPEEKDAKISFLFIQRKDPRLCYLIETRLKIIFYDQIQNPVRFPKENFL